MTRLLLLRHGETVWNQVRRLQGQADIALSKRGREQVSSLRHTVQTYAPTRVISSDLRRAKESATLLGFDDPTLDARWREADLGSWVGCEIAELRAQEPEAYQAWRAGTWTPQGAESFDALRRRVEEATACLLEGEESVLIATHGGAIRAVCANLLNLMPSDLIPVSPGSLTIIEFNGRARLHTFNLTAYPPMIDPPD